MMLNFNSVTGLPFFLIKVIKCYIKVIIQEDGGDKKWLMPLKYNPLVVVISQRIL